MSDGWQHKDDIPDDPRRRFDRYGNAYWDPQQAQPRQVTPRSPKEYGYGWPKRATSGHRYAIRGWRRPAPRGPDMEVLEFTDLYEMVRGRLHIYPHDPENNTFVAITNTDQPPAYPGLVHKDGEAMARFHASYKTAAGAINNHLNLARARGLDPMLQKIEERVNPIGFYGRYDHHGNVQDHHVNCRCIPVKPQQQTKRGEIEMNTAEMITIMQMEAGAKIVKATYINDDGRGTYGQSYAFKNVLGLELKEGDMIVAETRGTFALLTVTDPDVMATDAGCALHSLKHVVAKVRNEAFEKVKKSEDQAHRKLALSEVTSKLDTYKKQVGDGTFGQVAALLGAPAPEASDDVIDESAT